MSGVDVRQQGPHLRRWGYCDVYWSEPLCMHYPRSWKEAEVDVPCEGEDLPVLRGGLRKGRVHELSAPEHTDVWL